MANKSMKFKIGTTLKVHVVYEPLEELAPTTLENVTITSQVRTDEGVLVGDVTVTKDDDFMGFTLEAADSTSTWPHGTTVEWDIKMSEAEFGVFYTETLDLQLVRKVTA